MDRVDEGGRVGVAAGVGEIHRARLHLEDDVADRGPADRQVAVAGGEPVGVADVLPELVVRDLHPERTQVGGELAGGPLLPDASEPELVLEQLRVLPPALRGGDGAHSTSDQSRWKSASGVAMSRRPSRRSST